MSAMRMKKVSFEIICLLSFAVGLFNDWEDDEKEEEEEEEDGLEVDWIACCSSSTVPRR